VVGGTKELKRFIKVCSLWGTARVYTEVMAMVFSRRNFIPCQNRKLKAPAKQYIPLQNSVTYSTFTLVNDMPLAPRPEVKIEAVCKHQLASESV
jgi:hypothetical protein